MDGVRVIEIDTLPHKVRAIVKQNVEMTLVEAGVEFLNELVVLLFRRLDTESVDGPVVCGAYQLNPISVGRAAAVRIRRQLLKIHSAIAVP